MSKKTRKAAKTVEPTSTIFEGPALTMQQRKALEKQQKDEQRAAMKEAKRRLREEVKAKKPVDPKERKQVIVLIVALVALIALGVGMMLISNGTFGRGAKIGMTYYINEALVPEKSADGLSAEINRAYYTKNGGMCIDLSLANGMDVSQHPVTIRIKLMNANGEVITDATVGNIPSDFYVIFDGYNAYDVFIPKQFIKIPDDSLAKISYEITIESEDVE